MRKSIAVWSKAEPQKLKILILIFPQRNLNLHGHVEHLHSNCEHFGWTRKSSTINEIKYRIELMLHLNQCIFAVKELNEAYISNVCCERIT